MAERNSKFNPKIAVVGAGVVGMAGGRGLIHKKFNVFFIDSDKRQIKKLAAEDFEAYHSENLEAYLKADIFMISVSTPSINGVIKLDYLKEACKNIGRALSKDNEYRLIVARSTLLPGTCRNLVIKTIQEYSGKTAGKDFGVCMNPEYLREELGEKSAYKDFVEPWVIVFGEIDKRSGDMLEQLYSRFNSSIYRITLEEAEMQKYVHNLFNATKISFFNEFREICKDLNLNTDAIFRLVSKSCEGMWNPEYGTRDYGAYAGSCLPKDTAAFHAFAKTKGYSVPVLEATISMNEEVKELVSLRKKVLKS